MTLRRPAAALLASVAAAGALSACGDAPQKVNHGDSEAAYINIAGLKYQVQLSRQLNAAETEDASYLDGVSPADRKLPAQTVWFAVFMRVENEYSSPKPSAADFTITDTQGNAFEPVPDTNELAYKPEMVPPKGLFPDPDSVAATTPAQGAVLIYKIPYSSLDNRPLLLTIKSPTAPQKEGDVDLDV